MVKQHCYLGPKFYSIILIVEGRLVNSDSPLTLFYHYNRFLCDGLEGGCVVRMHSKTTVSQDSTGQLTKGNQAILS